MTQNTTDDFKARIRMVLAEMYIDSHGNLGTKEVSEDEILFDYELGHRFARAVLQKRIPELQNYELADYFPASGEKETYMFEQMLMNSESYNVFIEHTIINHKPHWSLQYGVPLPGERNDPRTMEVRYDSGEIATLDKFIQRVNQDRQKWSFDAW